MDRGGGGGTNAGVVGDGVVRDNEETGRILKRDHGDTQVRNQDIHPILMTMMQTVFDQKINFRVNALCKLAGLEDMRRLPQCNNNCFCWMLGLCEPSEHDATRCKQHPENNHPSAAQTPDDYAAQMCHLLQPGVDKLIANNAEKRQRM